MTQRVLIRTSRGGGVADARGVIAGADGRGADGPDMGFAGGALLLERCSGGVATHPNGCGADEQGGGQDGRQAGGWRVLAVGKAAEVEQHEAAGAGGGKAGVGGVSVIDVGDALLVPGMVNAHTHLDLTHIGPRVLESPDIRSSSCAHADDERHFGRSSSRSASSRVQTRADAPGTAHPLPPPAGRGFLETDPFVAWIEMIRRERHTDPALIARSVERGCALSRSAGVVAVGDIAGAPRGRSSLVPARAICRAGLMGVSFLEFFAIGRGLWTFQTWLTELLASSSIECADRCKGKRREGPGAGGLGGPGPENPVPALGGVRVGLQPHAPNTVDARAYAWAAAYAQRASLPLCSHVAETAAEAEFVRGARGPQRELLERLGLWDDDILSHVGRGAHPVAHALDALAAHPSPLVVHVNDLGLRGGEGKGGDDERRRLIERLARANATVVYCPRASAYFHAHESFGPHAYRELIDAGVSVALGTDSLVNLPASSAAAVGEEAVADGRAEPGRGMSVWDECRVLFARDATDPRVLLEMATTRGARALGLDERLFLFTPGQRVAGVVRLGGTASGAGSGGTSNTSTRGGVLERALRSDQPSALVLGP